MFLPEVWDATRCTDPSSGHHHHPLVLLLSNIFGYVLQGLLLVCCTTTPATGEKPSSSIPPLRVDLSEKEQNNRDFEAKSLFASPTELHKTQDASATTFYSNLGLTQRINILLPPQSHEPYAPKSPHFKVKKHDHIYIYVYFSTY